MARAPLVLCFAILDEVDVVDDFIAYHEGTGIDAFVGIDLGSTDGTLEKLAPHESRGRLHLTRLDAPDSIDQDDGARWVSTAKRVFDARWCLAADPDEFWVFPEDDAPRWFAALPECSVAVVPRYNLAPERTAAGGLEHFSDFTLLVRQPIDFHYDHGLAAAEIAPDEEISGLLWRDPPEVLRRVLPKVAARAPVIRRAIAGGHDVETTQADAVRHYAQDAFVAHVPFRSPQQYERKAANVSRFVERNLRRYPEAPVALHWIRLHELYKRRSIGREFERQVFDEAEAARQLQDGVLVRNDRLSRRLRERRAARRWWIAGS